jgi:hypothetical protein
MLKTDRVQSSIRDLTRHSAHDRQNLEIDDDVHFMLFFFVINLRIKFFVVVIVFFIAFIVSFVFSLIELIMISLEIELFTMLARRMILLFADNTHFDNDDDDVFDF